jgi:phytoene dehydrogenase-like protein
MSLWHFAILFVKQDTSNPSTGGHYDTIIIGCGMAGLAAGIRLAMFDRRVLILERHNAPGGLNSFYFLGGRRFDVGLHAVTNHAPADRRDAPLNRLLRQLRLPRAAFALAPQWRSRIAFPGVDLHFGNNGTLLEDTVAERFPHAIDGFRRLRAAVRAADPFDLTASWPTARGLIDRHLADPLLADMLLCPLMYYGSAREHDMDGYQFLIMWRALYEEGFARPPDGVRVIIKALLQRYRELGGGRRMRCGVRRLHVAGGRVREVELDGGERLTADHVVSTVGLHETMRLCTDQPADAGAGRLGALSFVETVTVLDRPPAEFGWNDTIVFFNHADRFRYARPAAPVDPGSGVICFPNNYAYPQGAGPAEGWWRVTAQANDPYWCGLQPEAAYRAAKEHWRLVLADAALRALPPVPAAQIAAATRCIDMFTPRTIGKFTGHLGGAVYGAPDKVRDGRTHLANLYLAGTDQGFLGIIGAMLSGISMANAHILSS